MSTDLLHFRCLDDGHLIEEVRKSTGPLVARQSTWCGIHDCPAVRLSSTRSDASATADDR